MMICTLCFDNMSSLSSKCHFVSGRLCSQQVRKQKPADEEKRAAAPSSLCDEASSSGFTEIPLSLPPSPPPQETLEEKENPVQSSDTAAQPAESQQTPSVSTTSHLTTTLQSGLNLSAVTRKERAHQAESNKDVGKDGGVEGPGIVPKVAQRTVEPENDLQLWSQTFVTAQFDSLSAPALYPSLPTLEEGSAIQLCEEAVKNCGREPAVLALPEQESSPLSLQPLKSVAELSRSKLYPELPRTAPEMQVKHQERASCCWEHKDYSIIINNIVTVFSVGCSKISACVVK